MMLFLYFEGGRGRGMKRGILLQREKGGKFSSLLASIQRREGEGVNQKKGGEEERLTTLLHLRGGKRREK